MLDEDTRMIMRLRAIAFLACAAVSATVLAQETAGAWPCQAGHDRGPAVSGRRG